MSRPIDADALIEFIENRYDITWEDDYEGGIKDACIDILEEIDKMPTIEPERKKGKWIVSHIPDSMLWECNQCGFDCGAHSFNFCPNCGADMRKENR